MSTHAMDMESEVHNCDGSPWSLKGGGTWRGHFLPGLLFLSWGLWWAFHSFRLHIRHQLFGDIYASQAWYPGLQRWTWALEPVMKVCGGPIGILVELRLDHPHFLNLLCREDGSFALHHIHNWQHASSYPAFITAGVVDFIGMLVTLPAGTQQVFMALAFFLEGFLMLMHAKHEALDQVIHWLLGCTMWGTALCIGLELHRGNASFLASIGRAYSTVMQGVWLMQVGQILFTDSRAWVPGPGAQMMAPVAFAMIMLGVAFALLLMYIALQWWMQRQYLAYSTLPITLHDPHESSCQEPSLEAYCPGGFGGDDSANEQSDGSEGHATPPQKSKALPGHAKKQLITALTTLRSSDKAPPRKRDEHII